MINSSTDMPSVEEKTEQSVGISSYIERFTSMFQSNSNRIIPPTFPRSKVRWTPYLHRKSYSVSIRQAEVQPPPLSTQEEKDGKTENAGKDEKIVSVTTEDTVVNSIIQQFAERSRVGLAKYGTTLDREDLDILDWIEHSKQEAMDFVLYLEKLKRVIQEMVSETEFVEENVV